MTVLIIAAIVALVLYIFGQKIYTFYLYRQKLNKLPGPNFKLPFFGLPLAVMRIKPYGKKNILYIIEVLSESEWTK